MKKITIQIDERIEITISPSEFIIWDLSEGFGIPIGRYAPIVFGWMVGSKGIKL